VQEAVDEQRAGLLVHLVLDRLAADRHLDDDVDVFGRDCCRWRWRRCAWLVGRIAFVIPEIRRSEAKADYPGSIPEG
jgi:hypothetical protein